MEKNILKSIKDELESNFHQPADFLFYYGFLSAVATNPYMIEQKIWIKYLIKRGLGSWDKKNRDNVAGFKNFLVKTAKELSLAIEGKKFSLHIEMWSDYCEKGLTFASGFWEGMCLWTDFDEYSNNNRFHLLLMPINTLIFPEFYAKYYAVRREDISAVVQAALRELPRRLYSLKDYLKKGKRNKSLIFKRVIRKSKSVRMAIFPFNCDIKPLS
ncbi:MAG TPA: hypothetical protein P5123_02095 [Spirochaetota bacterium]|nr:hypothetical protein [Spirochaetota bacterium]